MQQNPTSNLTKLLIYTVSGQWLMSILYENWVCTWKYFL